MCGRYTIRIANRELLQIFGVTAEEELSPRYDVRPTQTIPIVRAMPDAPRRELVGVRWGMIPHWADDLKRGPTPFNARSDTLASKPMFAEALKLRRCAIPASGYFEWKKLDAAGKKKQKYLTFLASGEPLAFAGLWGRWTKGPQPIESATIVTTEANGLAALVHDRMPVLLSGAALDRWLDPQIVDPRILTPLLVAIDASQIEIVPVRNDSDEDAGCIEPIGPPLRR